MHPQALIILYVQVLYDAAAGGAPLALLGALHPAPITDLAWSRDGRFLAASSYDGYCRRAPPLRISGSLQALSGESGGCDQLAAQSCAMLTALVGASRTVCLAQSFYLEKRNGKHQRPCSA